MPRLFLHNFRAGVKLEVALQSLYDAKSGARDTESGAILIDLERHMDAAEHVYLLNSYSDQFYGSIWGDKDTWALGFAAAGKLNDFVQVSTAPGELYDVVCFARHTQTYNVLYKKCILNEYADMRLLPLILLGPCTKYPNGSL